MSTLVFQPKQLKRYCVKDILNDIRWLRSGSLALGSFALETLALRSFALGFLALESLAVGSLALGYLA